MKSQYFDCACHSSNHTIRFDLSIEDNEFPDLYLSVQLNRWRNIFSRIWIAIRYIFGYECKYGHWDTWLLNHDDVSRLRELLEDFDKHAKIYMGPVASIEYGDDNPRPASPIR